MDDTHETHKQLMQEGGATEGLANVLTENLKRLSDQSLQVNGNLLSFREEVLDEFTSVHGEIKDIHHNAASNYQSLDAKIDSNYQSLDAKIDSNHQSLDAKIDSNHQSLDAKIDSNHQSLDAKIDSNYHKLDAKIEFSHTTLWATWRRAMHRRKPVMPMLWSTICAGTSACSFALLPCSLALPV